MYLTRFQINPRRRGAAKLLANPQAMHAAVLHGFPDPAASDAGRVLWRIDNSDHKQLLIVVSPEKPDLTHLVEQAGWPTLEHGWETRDYDELLTRLAPGQRWAFRLAANPVHALPVEPGAKRGKVVAHRTVEHQTGWLTRQAERSGFSLVTREVEGVDAETGQTLTGRAPTARVLRSELIRFPRGERTVTLRIAEFDGLLEIRDADAFRAALGHGIGPARAYGCGLLTIAPIG